jgi:hypothetical protein
MRADALVNELVEKGKFLQRGDLAESEFITEVNFLVNQYVSSQTARELDEHEELLKLRAFFKEVAGLTLNHCGMTITMPRGETADYAIVWPSDLATALEKVNPKWVDEVH